MFLLQSVSKSFGAQRLLHDADWQPPTSGVLGLVGPNGAGKTTLLRIICGDVETDRGAVVTPQGCSIGYLPQELAESELAGSALDVILQGRDDLLDLEARIEAAQARMDAGDEGAVRAHSDALERYEALGGWNFRARARQIGSGLGFADAALDRPITELSGGWQMRALLGRLLLRRPNVLLLDEPTNHLDTETIQWLEEFLARYEGLVILVSHDRWFLNRVVSAIVEIEGARLATYVGGWDDYRARKAELIEQRTAERGRQEREIARIQEFIERFRYKATKAKQVQSRARALDKIERVEVMTDEARDIAFRFPQPPRTPKIVADLAGVAKSYGAVEVWSSLDFQVLRGDKVALMGPNGAGKTTLLKVLAGAVAIDGGEARVGNGVEIAYFAQHAVEQLDPNATVLAEMTKAADVEVAPRVRSILGAFGFSGDDHHKVVKVLSGGEKNRLALAKMMLKPAGLLLLDEPTNHLDVTSRQVLEYALNDYEGAFVVVSHDRYFVNEVAQRVVHLEDGRAREYLGDYEYYEWKREEERAANAPEDNGPDADVPVANRKAMRQASAEVRAQKRAATRELRDRLAALEGEIAELEDAHAEAAALLQDPDTYGDGELVAKWTRQFRETKEALERAMEQWSVVAGEIESIEQQLDPGA